ncbi:hypothetical protein DPMN_130883 [Dreissena polymorpha]|uniref:Uncharacterized protein n=1 Tax=Dreissena polymorpha TaxID=45954 RepID=A0A9D4H7I0_DREPO|nr:hypothetical protein DPMN_130883 [Dreissena polymorpha]
MRTFIPRPRSAMNKLCSIENRQKSMDSKLGKLEQIEADIKTIFNKMSVIECRVSTLDSKLTETENKLMEIERSRSFDSQNCDELKSQLKHFEKLVSGQCEQNKILSGKIDSLNSLNSQLSEDIIDLQSRSMRDNLLFFNVPEEQSFESRKSENCIDKILNFCENDLKILNAISGC